MRLVFVTFLIAFVVGCNTESVDTRSRTNAAPVPVANWQACNSNDQTFAVEFPSAAEPWETDFDSPEFGHMDVHHVSAEFDGAMYGVNFNVYPRDLTDAEVQAELKHAYTLPNTGAEVLATIEIKMANIPAVEVISKTGPIYIVGRFFIADARRLYSLQVGSVRDPRKDREMIDRFFKSFLLLSPVVESSAETK